MTPAVRRRTYLREAALMLCLARCALHALPARIIFGWANRPVRRINRFAVDEAHWVAWSVETAGSRRWINASCLPRALAAQAMLRRRGVASRLCLGVAPGQGAMAAHAWIEVGEDVIVGGAEAARFTRLARFALSDPGPAA